MSLQIRMTGLAELRARINAMKERAANIEPALKRAGMVVLKAAKDHIKSGAGDQGPWPPNITGTPLLRRTGRLWNSLSVGGSDSLYEVSGSSVRVGTNVPYARWLQEGTGIYAGRGRIYPKHAKVLAWDGIVVRSIKGTPPRRYLYIDDAQAKVIRAVFSSYILCGDVATVAKDVA